MAVAHARWSKRVRTHAGKVLFSRSAQEKKLGRIVDPRLCGDDEHHDAARLCRSGTAQKGAGLAGLAGPPARPGTSQDFRSMGLVHRLHRAISSPASGLGNDDSSPDQEGDRRRALPVEIWTRFMKRRPFRAWRVAAPARALGRAIHSPRRLPTANVPMAAGAHRHPKVAEPGFRPVPIERAVSMAGSSTGCSGGADWGGRVLRSVRSRNAA